MSDFQVIKPWLYNEYSIGLPKSVSDVIKNNLPSEYKKKTWVTKVALIVHRLSEMPWYTQEQISDEIGISKKELIKLNKIIRESDFFQDLIVKEGLGKKYWNTIIPYTKNGAVEKVVNYEYQFPFRLALFPGLSCMYYCGFCGRNQKARFDKSILDKGNQRFKDIISSMPKYSTISISGGLEPLTNFGLSDIISHAKSLGMKVPLITNGHMLTSRYLSKNVGIWDLDSLRISLYGTDDESTYFVTRNKKAYKLVKNNTIEFLKLRNEINPNLKFGFNYIILPDNIDTIMPLLDYIIDINSKVNNGRGVDFLTLREDFGSVTDGDDIDVKERMYHLDGFLSTNQRKDLIKTFKEFNIKKEQECDDLHVDFGYAMVALGEGVLGKPLARVSGKQMRPSGYPQMSVAVDSSGDVFLYREAGFLDRPGNDKFIVGRITDDKSIEDVIKEFVESGTVVDRNETDCRFMDSYDHLMTLLVNQAESDMNFGVPFNLGPVKVRLSKGGEEKQYKISNNWYKD
jgi:dTDP-4-amino-4,6-dideoxy-D-glucose ammonia-lyase